MRLPAVGHVAAVGVLAAFLAAAPAGQASGTASTATPLNLANAIMTDGSIIDAASFETGPAGENAAAVVDVGLASFPTHGPTYAVLSSGDATLAVPYGPEDCDPESTPDPRDCFASISYEGGPRQEGGTDADVTVLQIDVAVPASRNCLTLDFRFLSEEFPDFVGEGFNDAFIAELDPENPWTTSGSSIDAQDSFALGPDGDVISINTTGALSMTRDEAAGTTYGGATPLLRASTPISQGVHSVYLSIFDQGDNAYDSAVFLDRMGLGTVANPQEECTPGATLAPPTVTKTADNPTSGAGGVNGYTITVSNPNTEDIHLSEIQDTLPDGFTYVADSTSGEIGDPSQEGQTLTWTGPLTVPAGGSFDLSFDVTVAGEAGEYFNEASAFGEGLEIEPTGPTAPITVTSAGPCLPVTLEGTLGSDKGLTGTGAPDAIKGLLGRDRIDGLGAADELCGDEGSDFVYGRLGADEIEGGTGNDRLNGNEGADHMDGGPGHDAFFAGQGVDQIDAQDGTKDCIVATPGVDQIVRDKQLDLLNPPSGCPAGFWL
jgi:uncharacterized repeat protein (TIGR01451 family)